MEDTKIVAKVVDIKGNCRLGHKVGDKFEISSDYAGNLCGHAYHSIFPFLTVLEKGGSFPWQTDRDVMPALSCPDGYNVLVLELRKLKQ